MSHTTGQSLTEVINHNVSSNWLKSHRGYQSYALPSLCKTNTGCLGGDGGG